MRVSEIFLIALIISSIPMVSQTVLAGSETNGQLPGQHLLVCQSLVALMSSQDAPFYLRGNFIKKAEEAFDSYPLKVAIYLKKDPVTQEISFDPAYAAIRNQNIQAYIEHSKDQARRYDANGLKKLKVQIENLQSEIAELPRAIERKVREIDTLYARYFGLAELVSIESEIKARDDKLTRQYVLASEANKINDELKNLQKARERALRERPDLLNQLQNHRKLLSERSELEQKQRYMNHDLETLTKDADHYERQIPRGVGALLARSEFTANTALTLVVWAAKATERVAYPNETQAAALQRSITDVMENMASVNPLLFQITLAEIHAAYPKEIELVFQSRELRKAQEEDALIKKMADEIARLKSQVQTLEDSTKIAELERSITAEKEAREATLKKLTDKVKGKLGLIQVAVLSALMEYLAHYFHWLQ